MSSHRFFLNKLLGRYNYVDDLTSLDPQLLSGLRKLKHMDADDFPDLALSFAVLSNDEGMGEMAVIELEANGDECAVTADNRARYIHLVADYHLNRKIARQSAAFLHGFRDLIHPRWLRIFNQRELQDLIGGSARPFDIEDMRKHVKYGGGYHDSQPVIQWFWDVVESFTPEEQSKLLCFVTSCSRPPLLGFKQLYPKLGIHRVPIESDADRLPTAGTCYNLLKLPTYSSADVMRSKLLYVINSNAGFELS